MRKFHKKKQIIKIEINENNEAVDDNKSFTRIVSGTKTEASDNKFDLQKPDDLKRFMQALYELSKRHKDDVDHKDDVVF